MKGRIRYGPGPAPHTASVWPKSSRLFSMPQYLAASNRPPVPRGRLVRKRDGSRPPPLGLEQAVREPGHEADVVEAVCDHDLERLGHDDVVALGHRLEHVLVEVPVEVEHRLVEGLPGIVLLVDLGGAPRLDLLLRLALRLRELRDAAGASALGRGRVASRGDRDGAGLARG